MHFTIKRNLAIFFICLPLLTACYTPPRIHTQDFAAPKTVAIVAPPEMKNMAIVDVFSVSGRHFAGELDSCFVVGAEADTQVPGLPPKIDDQFQANYIQQSTLAPRQSIGSAAAGGAVAGAMAGLIQGAADDTFKRSQSYHQELLKRVPQLSLRTDLMAALRTSFEAKGIQTSVIADSDKVAPRLRWPARDTDGQIYQASSNDHLPAVDADILVQISPIAVWNAPGQLNNYHRTVGIGVALYNGRNRQFLGQQTFVFNATPWQDEYARFDSLLEAGPIAANQMRQALLSLVPQIVAVVSHSESMKSR